MNATCCPSPSAAGSDSVSFREIDASCRVPLFVLFVSAAVWLVIASVLGLIASLKFHNPNLLADCACLTYGRVRPAATNALLYGFAIQTGLGAVIWLIARLGQTAVVQPWLIGLGGKLWNLGVTVGIVAILLGNSTGFESLEMPRGAGVILFISYLLIAFWAVATFHERRERSLSPSLWLLIAALFWFPWIFSTAHMLLTWHPVRGVMQAVVDWWFANNLNFVWLALVGLAAIFYLIPKSVGRPLHNRQLGMFVFGTLIFFGSWCGIPASAPVPAWIPVLSGIAAVLTLVTLVALGMNICQTKRGAKADCFGGATCFLCFGLAMFQWAGLMRAATGLQETAAITNFTWFTVAQSQLHIYGFFAMTMFGVIYYAVPQVTGIEWPSRKLVWAHFWVAAAGILIFALPLAIGGIVQGRHLNDPQVKFDDITKSMLMFFRISTTGELLMLIGHLLLLVNLIGLSVRYYKTHFVPAYKTAVADLKPVGVKP